MKLRTAITNSQRGFLLIIGFQNEQPINLEPTKYLLSLLSVYSVKKTPAPIHGVLLIALDIAWFKGKVQFSSVVQSCPTLCDPMDSSTPGFPVHHHLPESTQTHVHWVGDAIKPSHPLSSPSPPAFNLSQNQGPFNWVSSSHQVANVLEFQLQHQSFQWTPRTDLL